MKKIYIIHSLYSLLLILCNEKIKDASKIIVSKNDFSEEILKKLKKYFEIIEIYEPKNKIMKFLNYYFYLKKKLREYLAKDYEIIMSCDHRLIGQFFVKNQKEYILYEDGIATVLNNGITNLKLRRMLGFNIENFCRSILCKKIFLNNKNIEEEVVKKKSIQIDLKKLWKKLEDDRKNMIKDIFGIKQIFNEETYLLLTQPLSEDKLITEVEKIVIYKRVLDRYKDKKIIIKVHPREKTKYSLYFPECIILEEKYPLELLLLNGLKIKKIITLFSTAVFAVEKDTEIDFYGTRVHPKLLEKWGDSDLIMKANAFLEEE